MGMQPIELLERAFPAIGRPDLEQLAAMARITSYPSGTVLIREGEIGYTFYLISEGAAVITRKFDLRDEELIMRRCGPGDFFGEMAIIQDAPRSATVICTEDTTVLELDKEILVKMLQLNAQLALAMVRNTFHRLRDNDQITIGELKQAYQTLERLDKAKLEFIEVTAHELRTPLTVMRGYASILLADPVVRDNPVLKEITEGIVTGTQRLHEIVNNMLDVQRIDMDQVQPAAVPVSLPVVMRGLDMLFREALQERKISLTIEPDLSPDILFIEADPGLIHKALQHVLMNAIKYTPDGGSIEMSFKYEEFPEIGMAAHIQIQDTGIGIAKEYQKLIFEKFYRLGDVSLHSSGKTAFKAGGPGLGLSIAAGAINAHGGKIWVESPGFDEEKLPGSTFHIVLPVKKQRKEDQQTADAKRQANT